MFMLSPHMNPDFPPIPISWHMQYARYPIAALAWAALALQIWTTHSADADPVRLFSQFAILITLLAACSLTFVNHAWFTDNRTHGAITVGLLVSAGSYVLLLHGIANPSGLQLAADILLHYVVPAGYALHWAFVVEKGDYLISDAARWLKFPLLYIVFTLFRGGVTEWYPYPFLDLSLLPPMIVARNIATITAIFWLAGMVLVAIDMKVDRPEKMGSILEELRKQKHIRK